MGRLSAILLLLSLATAPLGAADPDPLPAGAVFRLGTARFTQDYHEHSSPPMALAPDGRTYAAVVRRSLGVYSTATGEKLWEAGFQDPALGGIVTFTADGRSVVAASSGGLSIWDAATGRKQIAIEAERADETLKQHLWSLHFLQVSNDLTIAASSTEESNLGKPGLVTLWDPTTAKIRGQAKAIHTRLHHMAISADGRVLGISGTYEPLDDTEAEKTKERELPGVVQLIDARSGKEVQRIVIEPTPFVATPFGAYPQTAEMYRFRLSPDGAALYTASTTGVRAWDVATGQLLRAYPRRSHIGDDIWLSADGKRLAASSKRGEIDVWETATGKRLHAGECPVAHWQYWSGGGKLHPGFSGDIPWCTVAIPADGPPILGTVDHYRLRFESIPPGKLGPRPVGHRGLVQSVGFTDDSKSIQTVGGSELLRWDAATGKPLDASGPVTVEGTGGYRMELRMSPNGRALAAFSHQFPDCKFLKVFDLPSGKERFTFPLPEGMFYFDSASFSADGRRLVAAIRGGEHERSRSGVAVWDLETGLIIFQKSVTPGRGDSRVSWGNASLSPNGSRLAWVVTRDRQEGKNIWEMSSWDIETGKRLAMTQVRSANVSGDAPVVCRDDRTALVSGRTGEYAVWDLVSGKFTRGFGVPVNEPLPLALSRDGTRFAVCDRILTMFEGKKTILEKITIYDWATGKPVGQIAEPGIAWTCAAFSPDGRRLVTGSNDSTAVVWDIAGLPKPK